MFTDQSPFSVRFEWGEHGLQAVSPGCAIIVIVDVLSFCTAVDVATDRWAEILPHPARGESAARYAEEHEAVLASAHRTMDTYSLSPASLIDIPAGTRLVLPSPIGAVLSLQAGQIGSTVAACLRNSAAVARFIRARGGPVAIIACGERWPGGSLRPAWEDLVGAGAVIAELPWPRSPEAQTACEAFRNSEAELAHRLRACSSGRELIERGFAADVETAAQINVSDHIPLLSGKAFVASTA